MSATRGQSAYQARAHGVSDLAHLNQKIRRSCRTAYIDSFAMAVYPFPISGECCNEGSDVACSAASTLGENTACHQPHYETANSMKSAQQFVRDLLWVVNSPTLLRTTDDHCCDAKSWRLQEHRVRAKHLADFMASKDACSLGRYFEGLISYWLHHVRKVDVLFESFAIREQKQTVGEIDFIFIDEQARVTHWEVAVKFYLFSSVSYGLGSHYLGPNAVDTLDRKIDRIFGHQLPLSKRCFPDVELRQAFVKGRIFYPLLQPRGLTEHPSLSNAHLDGSWLQYSEVRFMDSDAGWDAQNACYLVLQKPHWLSLVQASDSAGKLMSFYEFSDSMDQHFSESKRCPLVVQLKLGDAGYVESRRFFVVPNGWPHVV